MKERVKVGEQGRGIPEAITPTSYVDFRFEPARIEKKVDESPKVKSFYIRGFLPKDPQPGQFLMVWLPSAEEVPMSISDFEGGLIRISVAEAGSTTAKINKLHVGESLWIRGPFGKGFSLDASTYLLVGGGYGAAPLIYAAKALSKAGKRGFYAVGASNASELLFTDEARKLGFEVFRATDDGSEGHHGPVTDLLKNLSSRFSFDSVLTCGPEKMMAKVVEWGRERGIEVQASLERYMKCGFGICGSCILDPLGLRVCVDGPVFDGELLLKTEFGKLKRGPSGGREQA